MTRPRALALGGLAAFAGLVALQHAWRGDDLPPADHFVSEYARGAGGWVQALAFAGWAVSLAATAALAGRGRAVTRTALACAALGAVLAGAFVTDTVAGELPPGVEKTGAGRLHDLGSAGIFLGLLIAALASTRTVRARRYRLLVLGLGLALLAIPAALVAAGQDAPGWGQRGFIAVGCAWQLAFVQASSSRES